MYKPKTKKMLTVAIALIMTLSALAILSFAAEPAYASAAGTVTYNPTTFGISTGVDNFYQPTATAQTAQALPGDGSVPFPVTPLASIPLSYTSLVTYAFHYGPSGTATLNVYIQVAFNSSLYWTSGNVSITSTGITNISALSSPVVTKNGIFSTPTIYVKLDVTSLSLQSVGTTSSFALNVTGWVIYTHSTKTLTSTSVSETSIGSTASTLYSGNAALYGVFGGVAGPIETWGFVSGGTFSSGDTVWFYLSTTDSATGLVETSGTHYYPIGEVTLGASSPTTLNNVVEFFHNGLVLSGINTYAVANVLTPGTYYLLASDQNPTEVTSPSALTSYAFPASATQVVVQTAQFFVLNAATDNPAVGQDALTVGGTGLAYGQGWDSGASISITLSYPGGTVLATATASSTGIFAVTFTVGQMSGTVGTYWETYYQGNNEFGTQYLGNGAYQVIAQETNVYSGSFGQGGITANSTFDVAPTLIVSPLDITGAAGSTLTLTGEGFPAGGTIVASTVTSPTDINSPTFISVVLGNDSQQTATYHASVTVSSTGQFNVTITTVDALTTTGPFGIEFGLSAFKIPTYEYFYPAFYVSSPDAQALGFYFSPSQVDTHYYPVLSSVAAAVFDFPANSVVSIMISTTIIANVTTDSNGFAELPASATLPAMPAGYYYPVANDLSAHLTSAVTIGTTSFYLKKWFNAFDPAGNPLSLASPEFVPQNGTITVVAYGLYPGAAYNPVDTSIGYYYYPITAGGTNFTLSVGTVNNEGFLVPAANGTIIFSYQPFYGAYDTSTGYPATIYMYGVNFGDVNPIGGGVGYAEIGAPEVQVGYPHFYTNGPIGPGQPETVAVNNLIPSANFYPGTSNYYNLYIGSQEIIATDGSTMFTAGELLTGITFTVPSLANGIYNVSVTYAGTPLTTSLAPENTLFNFVIVSTPGTSVGSGTLVNFPVYNDGSFVGYEVIGYGMLSEQTPTLYVYNGNGLYAGAIDEPTGTYGAFLQRGILAAHNDAYFDSPAGTYDVVLSLQVGITTVEFTAPYTVFPSIFLGAAGYNGYDFFGYIGENVYAGPDSATGFTPGAFYNVSIAGMVVSTAYAYSSHSVAVYHSYHNTSGFGFLFKVPVLPQGQYYLNFTEVGSNNVLLSQPFYVLPSNEFAYPMGVTFYTANGTPTESAFPGEIVFYSATFYFGDPNIYNFILNPSTTVDFNGSAYSTLQASYHFSEYALYINGSFLAPNAQPGSYWNLTLNFSFQAQTSYDYTGEFEQFYFNTSYTPSFFGIAEGNGALLTGISQAQIAQLSTAVGNQITTSMAVPLSELHAVVTQLNSTAAQITTAFGTMTSTLSAINATVTAISNGQVTVMTSLGTIQASLANMSATLTSVSGNVATVNTAVGSVQTSLSSLGTTINSTASNVNNLKGSVVTITTDLGTFTGTVTSVSGGLATIQSELGTITTSTGNITTAASQIKSSLGTLDIFLIVIIVLVLITLVLAFLAINGVNRVSRKLNNQQQEIKVQQPPQQPPKQ